MFPPFFLASFALPKQTLIDILTFLVLKETESNYRSKEGSSKAD